MCSIRGGLFFIQSSMSFFVRTDPFVFSVMSIVP